MNKRLGIVLALIFVCIGSIALAEKKNATVRIARAEGAAKEIVLNPAELMIETRVPWEKAADSEGDDPVLEFSSSDGKSMSFGLEFDEFESKGNVYENAVQPIEAMMLIDPQLKRPPMVTFTWGSKVPVFKGVIESVNTKYTLFLPDGTPCRATVNVHMKTASKVRTKTRQ